MGLRTYTRVYRRSGLGDWVTAVVALVRQLLDLFQCLNPTEYAHLGREEEWTRELQAWLASKRGTRLAFRIRL